MLHAAMGNVMYFVSLFVLEQQCRPASTGQANTPDQVAFVHGQMGVSFLAHKFVPTFLVDFTVGETFHMYFLHTNCPPLYHSMLQ